MVMPLVILFSCSRLSYLNGDDCGENDGNGGGGAEAFDSGTGTATRLTARCPDEGTESFRIATLFR